MTNPRARTRWDDPLMVVRKQTGWHGQLRPRLQDHVSAPVAQQSQRPWRQLGRQTKEQRLREREWLGPAARLHGEASPCRFTINGNGGLDTP